MKKVALAGGAPVTLANAPIFRGAVWGKDGTIYFVPGRDGKRFLVAEDPNPAAQRGARRRPQLVKEAATP